MDPHQSPAKRSRAAAPAVKASIPAADFFLSALPPLLEAELVQRQQRWVKGCMIPLFKDLAAQAEGSLKGVADFIIPFLREGAVVTPAQAEQLVQFFASSEHTTATCAKPFSACLNRSALLTLASALNSCVNAQPEMLG